MGKLLEAPDHLGGCTESPQVAHLATPSATDQARTSEVGPLRVRPQEFEAYFDIYRRRRDPLRDTSRA